ncbi:hypothetical protein V6N13_112127 [Hibiscus sabdariffa]|uniref:AB hydrolase-1 domain-containing protein n=1 Tax=Hibiscus sabdariffa TaxID=183260 RepID=A0ABR2TMV4_9ROSI
MERLHFTPHVPIQRLRPGPSLLRRLLHDPIRTFRAVPGPVCHAGHGSHGVTVMSVVGISYGGFVGYSMAAQFKERVEKLVLCCAGVCLEEKDMDEGMFKVKSVDEAVSVLLPQKPEKMRELLKISFHKPAKGVPTCFLNDFINEMCTEYFQERRIDPSITQGPKAVGSSKDNPVIIWGEHDQIFPLELAHRLKRHLGDNAELVIIKNAGHAINIERSSSFPVSGIQVKALVTQIKHASNIWNLCMNSLISSLDWHQSCRRKFH